MLYKEFGKKRPLLRLRKICKNLGIGAIVLSLTYSLAYSNHMRYLKENCQLDWFNPHSVNHAEREKNTLKGKNGASIKSKLEDQENICL